MQVSQCRPRIIPVMDIRGGVVVRAIAGRREEYKPLESRLTGSTGPLTVARALRDLLKTEELYIADLDAIAGSARPNFDLYEELSGEGFRTWIDAGVRSADDAIPVRRRGVQVVVAGSETLRHQVELVHMRMELGEEHIAFSVDLDDGRPRCDPAGWCATTAQDLINYAEMLLSRIIILDLHRVGTGGGSSVGHLCGWAKTTYPYLTLAAGGGVRGPEDLPALADAGVDAVLVASALHDGKFGLPGAAL
jgi:phosphoribosylformimino-5-aminoimidazole carboxamide ribotide isomerase